MRALQTMQVKRLDVDRRNIANTYDRPKELTTSHLPTPPQTAI